jgi:hypothetical protein
MVWLGSHPPPPVIPTSGHMLKSNQAHKYLHPVAPPQYANSYYSSIKATASGSLRLESGIQYQGLEQD